MKTEHKERKRDNLKTKQNKERTRKRDRKNKVKYNM